MVTKVLKKDTTPVQGDWNVKVGPDAYESWSGKVGQFVLILAPQRFMPSINKAHTMTFLGADIGRDHDLVMMTFSLNSTQLSKNPCIRFNLENLKDPDVAKIF